MYDDVTHEGLMRYLDAEKIKGKTPKNNDKNRKKKEKTLARVIAEISLGSCEALGLDARRKRKRKRKMKKKK